MARAFSVKVMSSCFHFTASDSIAMFLPFYATVSYLEEVLIAVFDYVVSKLRYFYKLLTYLLTYLLTP